MFWRLAILEKDLQVLLKAAILFCSPVEKSKQDCLEGGEGAHPSVPSAAPRHHPDEEWGGTREEVSISHSCEERALILLCFLTTLTIFANGKTFYGEIKVITGGLGAFFLPRIYNQFHLFPKYSIHCRVSLWKPAWLSFRRASQETPFSVFSHNFLLWNAGALTISILNRSLTNI